jgi:hypothetical protein
MENFCQNHISRSSISEVKIEHLTSSRFVAWISKPRAVISQSISLAKGVNSLNSEFLGAVTRSKTGGAELSNLLDQSGQARSHLQFPSLLIDEQGVQLPIHPMRLNMQIDQELLRLRTPPQDLEGSIDVFVNAVAAK